MGEDLEKFIERYPTYIEALEMLEQKDQQIAELEKELAGYKELQDQLGLKNVDEFEWFVMLDLLTDNEKNMHILDLHRELAELKEKAIDRPKFRHFEEYWYIENNPYCDNELQVFNGKIMEIICAYDEDWLYEYRFDTSCRYIEEDNIFATEQEALNKLKEMKGNE